MMKLAVFTVELTQFSPEASVQLLEMAGYDGVEWRVTPPHRGEMHLSYDNMAQQTTTIKTLCEKHHLEMPALASYEKVNDPEGCIQAAELARMLGVEMVRVWSIDYTRKRNYWDLFEENQEHLKRVIQAFNDKSVLPLLEIHMGTLTPSASAARRMVDAFSPEEIGVIFDPGNMIFEGREDWKLDLDVLGDYLKHVHIKNARWSKDADGKWRPEVCPVKDGYADWTEIVQLLKDRGYDGYLSFEDFSAFPVKDIKRGETAFDATLRILKEECDYFRKLIA